MYKLTGDLKNTFKFEVFQSIKMNKIRKFVCYEAPWEPLYAGHLCESISLDISAGNVLPCVHTPTLRYGGIRYAGIRLFTNKSINQNCAALAAKLAVHPLFCHEDNIGKQ